MLFVFINCSFDSPENQRMSKKILSEVRSVYGKKKWEKSVIKGKFPVYAFIFLPGLKPRILSLVIFFFYSHGIYV